MIRTIAYTGFDLAESIVRDEMTNEGRIQAQVSFLYGTDRGMFKRVDGAPTSGGDQIFKTGFESNEPPTPIGNSSSKVTYYVGNVEFIREGITSSIKRYIGSYLVITNVGNNPATFDYLLRDSLGSIDTIASETGALKSRQSFNAHGQRRQAAQSGITASWSTLSLFQASLFNTSTTTQGYTGHEQLDAVGLVHMNARLYDPELGRFIQADDFVEPEATQGLNRYSYVLNNPLSATDPSGNFSLRQALGVVVGIVAAILSGGLFAANALWSSFFVATAGGFASAAIATGSLKAGLWGAVSAAAFWGIGTYFSAKVTTTINNVTKVHRVASGASLAKVAAHAVTGGTLNALQGGKFGHGFVSAGFTEALSPAVGQIEGNSFGAVLSRTAASAAIGGTTSKLSGGSFANGAQTGAFQQLFSQAAARLVSSRQIVTYDEPDGVSDVVQKNQLFKDNIDTKCDKSVCMVDISLTIGADASVSEETFSWAVDDIKQQWSGAFSTDGKYYILNINVTMSQVNPDVLISAIIPATSPSPVEDLAGLAGLGNGNRLQLGNYRRTTGAHELGHLFGLSHQWNITGALMSYAQNRSLSGPEVGRLANRYRGK